MDDTDDWEVIKSQESISNTMTNNQMKNMFYYIPLILELISKDQTWATQNTYKIIVFIDNLIRNIITSDTYHEVCLSWEEFKKIIMDDDFIWNLDL